MRTGLETGIFPTKLLEKYRSLDLSDNDLLNILAFFCTDVDMERAARIRGYSSVGRMQAAMQHIFDKGLIVNVKGKLDFSPLLAACDSSPQPQSGIFNLDPKKAPTHPKYYDAYVAIKNITAENQHAWAKAIESAQDAGYTITEVINCVKYIHSYNVHVAKEKGTPVKPVYTSSLRTNLKRWLENGSPEKFGARTFDTDEIMKMINAD